MCLYANHSWYVNECRPYHGLSGNWNLYNGSTIGGPLDKNLTLNGSLTPALTGTSVAGTNTLIITTQSDEFGWTLAATITPVPLPAAAWLFATGLLGLTGIAIRKKEVQCP